MEVACAECHEPFQAQRSTARYCSAKCRVRAHRKRGPKLPQDVKTAVAKATEDNEEPIAGQIVDGEPEEVGGVAAAVRQALADAGQINTVQGQSALVLARRLDAPMIDTGAAVASMVKQLESTLQNALAGQQEEHDELEELRRRREERLRTG